MQSFLRFTKLPRKKLYYALAAAAILFCVGGTIIWKGHNQSQPVTQDIPLVRTAVIGTANTPQGYTYSGEVRGRYESQLAFQVTGKIVKRNVNLGSTVSAGDVLMQIDPRDLQQTVNSTSAQVYSAESQLRLAESNLHRYQQLYAQNAISRAQLDQYENAYEVAQAAVRQASAQYAKGSNQLDYSLLYADKSGVISSISAEAGQVVSAGQTVLTIVQDGEREIEISVPENRIEELRKAAKLTVSFWALPNINTEGGVREIAPMADPTTRTYKVRISLLNPPPEIKLGMTAAVNVVSAGDQTSRFPTIPLSAVYQTNDTPNVWIVTDQTVRLRPIQIGSFGNAGVQILSGLNPDDTIVTAGVHKLREGQKVRIADGDRQ
ncbi:efflux RND transporter periplasmic adaptor subunit|uniref:RND family efflux transporter, MFP subunit n=1 Tax=Dendrosporobacter quercicolus TaxID=146817 RepID=A0A1G9XZY8_9FIRM|nr:efflux RND transporter periplasmic adaptor subunit [Dendrosporobacter quercicolus]NSL49024.1 efflux RND transporter periplasmic adaptor subunit [Dendrosporobacter quercicolus DSM 1736]SDN02432.1 RND family efflux transporter, MFP subunit [Dendrosporobacter quercicolus]